MKKIIIACIPILHISCTNTGITETKLLNQRITRLEQQIDSLISDRDINLIGSNKSSDSLFYKETAQQFNRCQAITKKGTQCKRKAKNNNSCWQHEG
jgi:hypothetical protein